MQVLILILSSILLGFLLMFLPLSFILRNSHPGFKTSKRKINLPNIIMLLIGVTVIGGTLYLFYNII